MLRGNPTVTNNYLIKQLPLATVYLNRKFEVVYVSDKWIDDFNFAKRNVLGQKLDTLFDGIDAEWKKVLKNCLLGKVSDKGLQHRLAKDDEEQWFEWINIPWYDEKENVIGVIIQTEDITHRIQSELKVEKLEILLDQKSASTKIGSWEYDVVRNKLTWCSITKDLHEVVQNYVPNMDTAINFYKEGFSRNSIAMAVDKAIATGQSWNETCQLITAKGREITVVAAGKPIFKGKKLIGLVGTFQDISNTIETASKNKQQERHFKSIFNSSYQFTGILDIHGTFLEVNETAQKFAGLEESDIIGKKFWNAYWWPVPDYVKDGLKQVVKAAAQGEFMRSEIVVLDKNKNPIPVDFSIKPVYDEDHKIVSLLAEGRMIKEMVKARRELKVSEQKFRALYELSPISYILSDFETGEILDFNSSFEETTGYNKKHLGSLLIRDILVKVPKRKSTQIIKDLTTKNYFGPEEQQYIKKDGSKFPVLVSGSLVGNKKGRKLLWSTAQDITESKHSEQRIIEEKILLKTLIDNLPVNVYIKDLESRKTLVNKAEMEYSGIKDESEIIGKNDFDLYEKTSAKISMDEDVKIFKTLKPMLSQETISVKPDGTTTYFLSSKIPLLDDEGNAKGLIGISLDITELKRKEEELRGLINVTSLQNKKLINFAHIVSHNLRSHTANFSMLLDFLVSEEDPEEKNRIVTMLMEASDNLLETLENLNDVVAISTNVNLDKKPMILNDKILAVEQNLTAFLKNNNAIIINEVEDNLKVNVVPAYLESILMNFITNAVKYKDPMRKPVIRISAKKNKKYTIISIKDNGLGIDMEEHGEKLFGMYKTFHNNPEARGIGLYITKNQIEAMNGKILVDSEVGKGTTFNIYFNGKN